MPPPIPNTYGQLMVQAALAKLREQPTISRTKITATVTTPEKLRTAEWVRDSPFKIYYDFDTGAAVNQIAPPLPPSLKHDGFAPHPSTSPEHGGFAPNPSPSLEHGGFAPHPSPSLEHGGFAPDPSPSLEHDIFASHPSLQHGGFAPHPSPSLEHDIFASHPSLQHGGFAPHPSPSLEHDIFASHPSPSLEHGGFAPHPSPFLEQNGFAPHPSPSFENGGFASHPSPSLEHDIFASHPSSSLEHGGFASHPSPSLEHDGFAPHPSLSQEHDLPSPSTSREHGDISHLSSHHDDNVSDNSANLAFRRKKRHSDLQRETQKLKRMRGMEYLSRGKTSTVIRPAKKLAAPCKHQNCTVAVAEEEQPSLLKCHRLDDATRNSIFRRFWDLTDWIQRKQFVCSLVDSVQRSRPREDSRRSRTLQYYLKVGGERWKVCKSMFCGTLGIPQRTVLHWMDDANHGMPTSPLYSPPANSTPTQPSNKRKELAKEYLSKIDKVPSHYCRKSTTKTYVYPGDFSSFADLHRKYVNWLAMSYPDEKPLSLTVLKEILSEEKIAIFQPKKDRCDVCVGYEQGNVSKDEYDSHIERKEIAREEKKADKAKAKSDRDCLVLTADVQAVQNIPKTEASCLYFKTRLNLHNYTVYDLASGECVCYVWTELNGGLTSSVFASCITDFLTTRKQQQPTLREVVVWSDGCTSQNRNSTLLSALSNWAFLHNVQITTKYLEKGHSQMEVDSVHAKIEAAMKHRDVEVPADYCTIVKEARKTPSPYQVKYLPHSFFLNYELELAYESIRPGNRKGDPCVTNTKQYLCKVDGTVLFKLSHRPEDTFELLPRRRRSALTASRLPPPPLYSCPLPIPARKFKDLQELKTVLHPDHHPFYDSLPHN